jgi:predicted ATPase
VGVRGVDGLELFELLRTELRDLRALLVLDNCEHVVEAAPRLAELLAACPRLKVLATSREPLRVRQERLFPVGPLAVPDLEQLPALAELLGVPAVALFVARAQAARPDFRLEAGNARAVAEVCVALDGLPLALELVAARVRVLSPWAMRGRPGRLALLAPGPRDAPARHRSLRAALDWSYELLTPAEQALFRRLGLLMRHGTLVTAEAVCRALGGAADAALGELLALADKSLVQVVESPAGEPHFRLAEPVRAYALERLAESGELNQALQCHAACLSAPLWAAPEQQPGRTHAGLGAGWSLPIKRAGR